MPKDDQININIEKEQKEKWMEHAEDYGYRNRTVLIEKAVERQIREDRGEEYSVEQDIEMVMAEVNRMSEQLDDLEDITEKIEATKSSKLDIEEAVERLETYMDTRFDDE